MIKSVRTWTEELPIAQYLTSPERMSDPRNRSVPVLDVIMVPGDDECVLMVMPMLLRFDILPFRKLGEFAEAIHQLLQVGLYILDGKHLLNLTRYIDDCRGLNLCTNIT